MKRVRFHLRHPTDPDRVDVIVVSDGAVLVDSQATGKYTPLVTVSQLVKVELLDDVAEQAVDHEAGAAVAPTPDPLPETEMRTPHFVPVYVPSLPAASALPQGVQPDQGRHHEVDQEHPSAAGAHEHRGVGEDAPDDEGADRHGNEQGTEKQEQPHRVSLSWGIDSISAGLGSDTPSRWGALPLGEEPNDAA